MKLADVAKMTLITPFVLNFTEAMVFANNLFIVSALCNLANCRAVS